MVAKEDYPHAVCLDYYRTKGQFGEEIVLQLDCYFEGKWPDISEHGRGIWLAFDFLPHPRGGQITANGRMILNRMGVHELAFCTGALMRWRSHERFGSKSIRFPLNQGKHKWPEGVKQRILCKFLTWGHEYDEDQLLEYAAEFCGYFEDMLTDDDLEPEDVPEQYRSAARFHVRPLVFYQDKPFVDRAGPTEIPGGSNG